MSLFLGKVGTTPVLHVTNSSTELTPIKTLTPLSNTVFHSSSTFATVSLIATVTSVDAYYDFSSSATIDIINYHDMVLPTEVYKAAVGTTSDVYFIVCKHREGTYRIPILPTNTIYSLYSMAWGLYPDNGIHDVFSYMHSTTGYHIVAPYSYTSNPVASGSTSTAYVYKISYVTPAVNGEIKVSGGDLIVGTTNFKSYMYLNMFQNNSLDTMYNTPSLNIQILNSQKDAVGYGGITLKNNSIYYQVNDIDYLLFGHAHKNTSSVISSTNFTDSTSLVLPVASTLDSLIIVGVNRVRVNTPIPFTTVLPSFQISGSVNTGAFIYYSNNAYNEGSVVVFSYTASTRKLSFIFRVWGGGGTSDHSISSTVTVKVLK